MAGDSDSLLQLTQPSDDDSDDGRIPQQPPITISNDPFNAATPTSAAPSMPAAQVLIRTLREEYHRRLCADLLGYRPNRQGTLVFSNADGSNALSIDLAERIAHKIGTVFCATVPNAQRLGSAFGICTEWFLREAFGRLGHLRPGTWIFSTSQAREGIAIFEQYEHLAELAAVLEQHNDLKAALGGDYFIKPDIVVGRQAVQDAAIDEREYLVNGDSNVASLTPLRLSNRSLARPIRHASISCKWTMRSDRAQNTRTEALNLIRNRKGHTPHIMAVTFEPLATRLASIAMGTGDIDCTYHGALPELVEAANENGDQVQVETLQMLIDGRRLRDISDLPFDLAI